MGDEDKGHIRLSDRGTFSFGRASAARPAPEGLHRSRFRIAVFGDFTGRAARGAVEAGAALAARRPILLDIDTVEEVIEGFATRLVLPIGKDGAGIAVDLRGLDDLHPDELFDRVEIFAGLSALKRQLANGATAQSAVRQLEAWGAAFGRKVTPPSRLSGGASLRADLRLSDFQRLIGDTSGHLQQASPLDDLLARIVGPHVRALPDPNVAALQKAVDATLSEAMRLVLHHPDFQALEAQWRMLDLLARQVETDDSLEIMLYDISAEEIAADLAAAEDVTDSGLAQLLTGAPLAPGGRGGYSALIGLYSFEETPPHAELLGRIARLAAHVDAPFVSALSPAYLDIPKKERHPRVAESWDALRALPEAGYLGLASPRFLLRRSYGKVSDPISAFPFEEFTPQEGLRGMLWANPAVLVAILLARSFRLNGPAMQLGTQMVLGDMPYEIMRDRFGDQLALPCTERNISLALHEHSLQRGVMPVLAIKGRDEIRLGSFNGLNGATLLGRWSGIRPPASPPGAGPGAVTFVATPALAAEDDEPQEDAAFAEEAADLDADLAAFLASFGPDDAEADDAEADDTEADETQAEGAEEDGAEEMDPYLAALLAEM
ncbi:type VI secretion system contractile sheath domain-containing protein [Phaeovulum sp. W22_SRMD_FR3]|uniref:type VI secretion system contractile sheath domain-containing protein n=1 Tax=Phaeovulum sp. W22_SRMD_FR3 TaxID=3240274 RepID=UPI003F9700FD